MPLYVMAHQAEDAHPQALAWEARVAVEFWPNDEAAMNRGRIIAKSTGLHVHVAKLETILLADPGART